MSTIYRFDGFTLDVAKRELWRDGHAVVMPARVMDCLIYLIQNRERAIGRDELISAVFGRVDISDAQLGQLVLRARRAVDDDGQAQRAIRTIPRFGFRWTAPVETIAPGEDEPILAAPAPQPASQPDPPEPDASFAEETDPPPPRWHALSFWQRIAFVLTLAVPVLFAGWFARDDARGSTNTFDTQAAVAVKPAVIAPEDQAEWARLGLMDFVARRLREAGLPVVPDDTTLGLVGESASGDDALLRTLTGADHVIEPSATRQDGRWQVTLHGTDQNGIGTHATGVDDDLLQATGFAVDRLLAALGRPVASGRGGIGASEEQLLRAKAAMLANRLDTARDILESIAAQEGRTPALRYQLVQIDFRAGRYEEGLAEIDALLATIRDDPGLRAQLLNSRGVIGIRLDRYVEAERDFDIAIALLDPLHDPAEWGRAMTGRGVTRLGQGRLDEAAADLAAARVQLVRTGDAIAVARVDSNIGHIEVQRDRPHRALAYFTQAARDFESLGAINELLGTLNMQVETHLDLMQIDQASIAMERLWSLRPRVEDPAQRAMLDLARAQMLLRQGQLAEARTLLDPPRPDTRPTPRLMHEFTLRRVELALESGQPAAAVRLADATLALGDALFPPLRDWLALRREQAAAVADLPPLPVDAIPLARERSLPAMLSLAIGLHRAGQTAAADALSRDAIAQAERTGVPALVLEAVVQRIGMLVEFGRATEAATLAGQLAPWAGQDYRAALALARLYRALGQSDMETVAMENARRLAGERPLPVFPPVEADAGQPIR